LEVPAIENGYVFPLYHHQISKIFHVEDMNELSPATALVPFLAYYIYKTIMVIAFDSDKLGGD
jgi:hypothetical protein